MRVFSHPERFYEAFAGMAVQMCRSAELLRDLLAEPARADEILDSLAGSAREADALREHLIGEASAVAVAPLPREDVHQVALLLGEMVRMLNEAATVTQSLHLGAPREPAAQLADVVVRAARCIQASVASFRQRNFIAERCADMEPLAHEGQAIYDRAVEALFAGDPDPLEVVRWKEVYDMLEHMIEHCQKAENALASIVLENRD